MTALHKVFAHWQCAVCEVRYVRELEELRQDNAWYQLRDLAVAGPRLLLPLARLEAYLSLHITFSAWRGFIVDLRNMEAAERIMQDTRRFRVRARSIAWQAADKVTSLREMHVRYRVIASWRQQLFVLRMERNLVHVRSMTSALKKELARRMQQSYVALMSKVMDSWRWCSDRKDSLQRHKQYPSCTSAAASALDHAEICLKSALATPLQHPALASPGPSSRGTSEQAHLSQAFLDCHSPRSWRGVGPTPFVVPTFGLPARSPTQGLVFRQEGHRPAWTDELH